MLELRNQLDFDAASERELRDAESAARVQAFLSEDLLEHLRRAVGDEVLLGEAGRAVDQDEQLDDALDAGEIDGRHLQRAEEIHRDRACGFLSFGGGHGLGEAADPWLALACGDVTGDEERALDLHEWDEQRAGSCGRRGEAIGDLHVNLTASVLPPQTSTATRSPARG